MKTAKMRRERKDPSPWPSNAREPNVNGKRSSANTTRCAKSCSGRLPPQLRNLKIAYLHRTGSREARAREEAGVTASHPQATTHPPPVQARRSSFTIRHTRSNRIPCTSRGRKIPKADRAVDRELPTTNYSQSGGLVVRPRVAEEALDLQPGETVRELPRNSAHLSRDHLMILRRYFGCIPNDAPWSPLRCLRSGKHAWNLHSVQLQSILANRIPKEARQAFTQRGHTPLLSANPRRRDGHTDRGDMRGPPASCVATSSPYRQTL